MKEKICQAILEHKVIAIAREIEPELAAETAEALYAGGIRMLEVTFNQSDADAVRKTSTMIAQVRRALSGRLYVGAGTVMTEEQVRAAADAGAQFILSAATDRTIIELGNSLGLVTIPGALSPSEIAAAHTWGADFVKLFPAGNMGISYLKAVRAPLPHIRIIAVGGINEQNMVDFLAAGAVGVGVGSNLVDNRKIIQRRFREITEAARRYTGGAAD